MNHRNSSERLQPAATETSPLLRAEATSALQSQTQTPSGDEESAQAVTKGPGGAKVASIIALLLIGVFIANADGSLVLATNGTIASHFGQLENAAWLSTSYVLAMCVAQPVTGKLSDIYGRKPALIVSYILFALGCVLSGVGHSMAEVIIGRAVAGLGGAGVSILVSVLIADLVPPIQVASWRSYVNVVATVGRSLGGPVGGYLTDSVGWRWAFVGQAPIVILALLFIILRLRAPKIEADNDAASSAVSKIRRIDFVGALLLGGTISLFLVVLDLGGQRLPWTSSTVIGLAVSSMISGVLFVLYEVKVAKEPIFPPGYLLRREFATSYLIIGLQIAAQMGMMFSVPLYFQVTANASNVVAGSHLFPAVAGNAVGGLLTGFYVSRTGRYKYITTFAAGFATISYMLLYFRWRGQTTVLESLEIVPGGFGTGIALASSYMILTAAIEAKDNAVATSGFYLSQSLGMIAGVSATSSIRQGFLRFLLSERLHMPNSAQIITKVLSDVSYVHKLDGKTRIIVSRGYVEALDYTFVLSAVLSVLALMVSLLVKEHRIIKPK